MDPTAQFKEQQKINWANFSLFENVTGSVAARLVSFAGIRAGAVPSSRSARSKARRTKGSVMRAERGSAEQVAKFAT